MKNTQKKERNNTLVTTKEHQKVWAFTLQEIKLAVISD